MWFIDNLKYPAESLYEKNVGAYENGTLRLDPSRLQISHCWAKALKQTCRLGISTRLLLVVLICVVVKATAALAVTWMLLRKPDKSLVTIGDAITAFICSPDANTHGMCVRDQSKANSVIAKSNGGIAIPCPKEWCKTRNRLGSVIPKSVWATSYSIIGMGILLILGGLLPASWFFRHI